MIPAPKALLMALDRLGIYVELDKTGTKLSITGALARLTDDLKNRLREHKPAILALLAERQAYRDELADKLARCQQIIDVELLVGETTDGYHTGTLSLGGAEAITRAVIAHTKGWAGGPLVPQKGVGGPLPKTKKDTCPACWKKEWWYDQYNNRKCFVCAPPPHASVVARMEEAP